MSAIYETGHVKTVANFEILVTYVIGFGAIYKPSRAAISVGNLQVQLVKAKDVINEVNVFLVSRGIAVAAREIGFAPLKKLGTRLLNALKATDTPVQVIENLATINRKLQGKRASAILTDKDKDVLADEGKMVNQISVSQQGYDSRLDHFDKLVKLLASIPLHKPNEKELKVTTLTLLYTKLQQLNVAVITTEIALSNARLLRNEAIYNLETGVVATAKDVKAYAKSLFGANVAQYKQVSGLIFKMMK